jgi:RNA polymerase sigma factor (TIGR02999 family)
MTDLTCILSAIEQGDPQAAEQLLPLVYNELRKLAVQRLAHEKPGQTLQATALVHEAYLRLVDGEKVQRWDSRAHFFAAAAEAMRRILVDETRRKRSIKRGGMLARHDLSDAHLACADGELDVLVLDEALARLAAHDAEAAELVKLRFFAGMTMPEAASALGVPPANGGAHLDLCSIVSAQGDAQRRSVTGRQVDFHQFLGGIHRPNPH